MSVMNTGIVNWMLQTAVTYGGVVLTFILARNWLVERLFGHYLEAEQPSGLPVDDELELERLQDGQIGRFLALQDAAGIDASLTPTFRDVGSVAHPRRSRRSRARANHCPVRWIGVSNYRTGTNCRNHVEVPRMQPRRRTATSIAAPYAAEQLAIPWHPERRD
jgi:hypothetical protein